MMWKYAARIAAVSAITGVSSMANAGFLTAQALYMELKGTEVSSSEISTAFANGKAYGYVFAVLDSYESGTICQPDATTGGQVLQVVKNYLAIHPESWGQSAAPVAAKALADIWPCPAK